jgi:hypothetical protein
MVVVSIRLDFDSCLWVLIELIFVFMPIPFDMMFPRFNFVIKANKAEIMPKLLFISLLVFKVLNSMYKLFLNLMTERKMPFFWLKVTV